MAEPGRQTASPRRTPGGGRWRNSRDSLPWSPEAVASARCLILKGNAHVMNPTLKPWIRWIRDEEATGALRRFYDEAVNRAGRIWNIVRIMSLRPQALTTSIGLYLSVVQTRSPRLGRAEREMIAVVVSQANACHY